MGIKNAAYFQVAVVPHLRWAPFEGRSKDCAFGLPLRMAVAAVRERAAFLSLDVVCWLPICPRGDKGWPTSALLARLTKTRLYRQTLRKWIRFWCYEGRER